MNKICTSLEQSKKLIELGIDVKTADMYWWDSSKKYYIEAMDDGDFNEKGDIPAWSLTALLDILKYPSLTQDVENKWSITDWTGFYPKSQYGFDNPIDACYEMILKLYEENLL